MICWTCPQNGQKTTLPYSNLPHFWSVQWYSTKNWPSPYDRARRTNIFYYKVIW